MKTVGIDIPVYLNFFNRPDTFRLVFEAVREARPSKLFLSCDGPRLGNESDKIRAELSFHTDDFRCCECSHFK